MFLLSNQINKINRILILQLRKCDVHSSVCLLDKQDDKKNIRDKLNKMSFVNLESKKRIQKKVFKQEVISEKPVVPSVSLQFSATLSQSYKQNNEKIKSLEESADAVAKFFNKNKDEQAVTRKEILEPLYLDNSLLEKVKVSFKNRNDLDKNEMKRNESELKNLMNKSDEGLNEDEGVKQDEETMKPQRRTTKPRFWSDSPYQQFQNLTSGNGLSLFSEIKQAVSTRESPIWSMHYDEELKLAQEIPPINGFDEMIKLTNEGKLWKFPIDNEQDIDELEAQVPFHEHVFLDQYLEEFPQIEQIQQFMSLALNGLSQNSFLSIKEKRDIINWYKTYFNEKLDIIKEALEAERQEASYRETLAK